MRFFLFLLVGFFLTCAVSAAPADSIGIEKVNGNVYVLHRVEEKETLYSLSKRYEVEIDAIIAVNPSSEFGLNIGEILKILIKSDVEMTDEQNIVHTVQPGETLYSISRRYEVEPEMIKKWNRISTNILDIGQKLTIMADESRAEVDGDESEETEIHGRSDENTYHVVADGETLYSLSRKYEVPLEDLRAWNNLEVNDIAIGQEIIVGRKSAGMEPQLVAVNHEPRKELEKAAAEVIYADAGTPLSRENTNFDEVVESGLAEVIEGSSNNRKYLALHRTAKVGTIMRVRNDMNGQEVFVRIIGKLPDTGANRNILIKISRAAYDKLGAIDDKFRITVSFIP